MRPGELDEGYRITVAARDGRLYNIKSGALSRSVIQLDSQPVGVVSSSCHSSGYFQLAAYLLNRACAVAPDNYTKLSICMCLATCPL
jgi:hypothetical protein